MAQRTHSEGHPQAGLLRLLLATGGISVLIFGFLYVFVERYGAAAVEFVYLSVIMLSFFWLRKRPDRARVLTVVHIVGVYGVCLGVTLFLGGPLGSAGFIMWALISPMAAMVFLEPWGAFLTLVGFFVLVILVSLLPAGGAQGTPLPEDSWHFFFAANVIGASLLVISTVHYFLTRMRREQRRKEQAQAELLKSQKLESLGTLAGGIAHDFNNILMAFAGNIGLARTLCRPGDEVSELLGRAERALEQATGLTRQLLTFSRGGAPVRSPASIAETIYESAAFVLHGSNCECAFHIPEDLWAVEADLAQISQLVQNLVLNADQFMPEGGTITVRCENRSPGIAPALDVEAERHVAIVVSDQGPGIPENIRERIFEPYFSTRTDGSGLGLAAAYAIVKNHEGSITVRSTPGVGTTFVVLLPASDDEPAARLEEERGADVREARILVMDDEEPVREVLGEMLRSMGMEAVLAEEGGAAVSLYGHALHDGVRFDLVILDLTVRGGMGGVETAMRLREIDPSVLLIASSGYANNEVMAEHRRFGFVDVLRKPYNLVELERVLGRVLSEEDKRSAL